MQNHYLCKVFPIFQIMGKFTEFKLPLKSLSQGVHEFDFHLGAQFFANMENADIRDADLNVKLTVTCRNDKYKLDFVVSGNVTLLCDRCLDDLIFPIDTTYSILVEFGKDYNCDSDELLIIPDNDPTLNVAYMIYDTVVLAIPIKHVHPMGKCNRQMSALLRKHRARPGDNDADLENDLIDEIDEIDNEPATDPRWDALKSMPADED